MPGTPWLWIRNAWRGLGDLFQTLSPCRFSVLTLFVGVYAFLFVPQGQDVLHRLTEWNQETPGYQVLADIALLLGAIAVWALSCWYWARLILSLRPPDAPPDTARLARLRVWVPRILGTLAFAGMAVALLYAAHTYVEFDSARPRFWLRLLAAACLALGALFFLFVTRRRELLARTTRHGLPAPSAQYPTPQGFPRGTLLTARLFLALALILGLLFTVAPVAVGRFLGTVPVLLLTAAIWVLFGTTLVYFSRRFRLPLLTILLVLLLVFSRFNDDHAVRLAEGGDTRPAAGTLAGAFRGWYQASGGGPVFLVTSEGGGIRAAYWTALVLAELEDRNPDFSRRLFALSGVSGGSVGGGVFAALVREGEEARAAGSMPAGAWYRGKAEEILGHDFLSPVLAKMVAPDLAQRFLFFPMPFADRAWALEDGWAKAWEQEFPESERLSRPFLELWEGEAGRRVPALLLNGTHVETGRRIVATNLPWQARELPDTYDLLRTLRSDLPLKTAIHNSARFTYMSPAGTLRSPSGTLYGHVVDGGYFENSGAATLLSVLQTVARECQDLGCRDRIYVLYLRNNPSTDPDSPRDPADPNRDSSPDLALNEVLSPVRALLDTRDARGTLAMTELRGAAENLTADSRAHFFELGLCEHSRGSRQKASLPLGWTLSETSRSAMADQLDQGCEQADNPGRMRQILSLLPPPGATPPAGASLGKAQQP
jgi:hypothetical protein